MEPVFQVRVWCGWQPPAPDSLALQITTVQNVGLFLINCPGTLLEKPHPHDSSASLFKLQLLGYQNRMSGKPFTYIL